MKRIGILGGTFNPVHIGHIRPAVAVAEVMECERIDFLPCASPPHKTNSNLLPFELRVAMLETAIAPFTHFSVNQLEFERSGPSYTYDTLRIYHAREPECRPFFIMGAGDFIQLPQWHRGIDLPELTDLVVIPRATHALTEFHDIITKLWPQATLQKSSQPFSAVYSLPSGNAIYFLPQPRIDISATLIRDYWLQKKDITYLVPNDVLAILQANADIVTRYWKTC